MKSAKPRLKRRDFVAALEKGLSVIEALGASGSKLTLSDVARGAGITRAAARRFLLTLTALGHAEYDGQRFALTPRVLRLGYAYFSSASLPRLAQPVLERVGERTHEVASLAVLDGTEVLFLGRSTRRRIVSATTGVGTRMPAYCSAMGRALLAHWPESEIDAFLRSIPRDRLTPKTKTGMRELLDEIAKVREQSYAISDEELEIGLRSIAVPVADSRGQSVVAIAVSLQASHMTAAQMVRQILPTLRSARDELAAML